MNLENDMHFVGRVEFAGNVPPEQGQEVVNALQELMNKHRIIKIDLALNPWQRGPMKIQPKGPVISFN